MSDGISAEFGAQLLDGHDRERSVTLGVGARRSILASRRKQGPLKAASTPMGAAFCVIHKRKGNRSVHPTPTFAADPKAWPPHGSRVLGGHPQVEPREILHASRQMRGLVANGRRPCDPRIEDRISGATRAGPQLRLGSVVGICRPHPRPHFPQHSGMSRPSLPEWEMSGPLPGGPACLL